MLPFRHWRWLWLALVFRLVIGLPYFAVAILPYWFAKGIVWACDWLGGQVGNVYVRCYNRDVKRSGWRLPERLGPKIELSPEWKRRLHKDEHGPEHAGDLFPKDGTATRQ